MSLYHFSLKHVSRNKGQAVVNSAAYISGERLRDNYYEKTYDYTRKRGVVFTEVMLPDDLPARFSNRQTLWNELEFAEKGKSAQLAYSFDIALQNELTMEENIQLAREFCREQFVSRGMIVDMAVHEGKNDDPEVADNPHFHVLAPIRPLRPDGTWGNKQRREYRLDEAGNRIRDGNGNYVFSAVSTTGWNSPELLEEWRRAWADKVNAKFREKGLAARVDHRSYEKRGIELIPTIHEGYEVRAMERKGIRTAVGNLNRVIREINKIWIQLKESVAWLKTLRDEVNEELYRRANPTLAEVLQEYYDQRNRVADSYQYGRDKAHLTNLKEFSSAFNYLMENKITSAEQLNQKIKEIQTVVDGYRSEIKARREKLTEYDQLLEDDKAMKNLQPVIDQYGKIFFKSKKQKFYEEHKSEIKRYRMCERKLKPYRDAEGKLPISTWKKEKTKMKSANEKAEFDLSPYKKELEMAQKVSRCVDTMLSDKERQQAGGTGRAEKERTQAQRPDESRTEGSSPKPTAERGSIREKLNRNKERIRREDEAKKSARQKTKRSEISL